MNIIFKRAWPLLYFEQFYLHWINIRLPGSFLTYFSIPHEHSPDICEVPQVDYTSLMEPAAGGRVLEGDEVTLHCNQGFYYGNKAASEVTCNADNDNNNNFPASCRGYCSG